MASRKKHNPRTRETQTAPAVPSATSAWQSRILVMLPWLCVAALIPATLHNFAGWWTVIRFPGEANFGEGVVLFESLRLARGENIYGDPSQSPYWICTYPPLFQALCAPFASGGFLWPRLLAMLSSLGSAALLCALAQSIMRRWSVGVVAALLWINSMYVDSWSPLARVDIPGRFLQSAAIACILLIRRPALAFWASLLCATLAMLVKQNMFAAAPVCMFVLLMRSWRRAAAFGGLWMASVLAVYVALHLLTGGQFLRHIVTMSARPFQWPQFVFWLQVTWESHWPYLVSALPAAVWCAANWRTAGWVIIALAAGLPNVILAGNDGSDRNYYFDLLWPLCLLASLPMGIANRNSPEPKVQHAPSHRSAESAHPVRWLSLAGSLCAAGCIAYYGYFAAIVRPTPYPGKDASAAANQIITTLRESPGPVLTEFAGYALAAGKEPDYLAYMMRHAEVSGTWNPDPVVKRIETGGYGTMLISNQASGRFGPRIVDAMRQHYEPVQEIPKVFVVEGEFDALILKPNLTLQ